MAVDIMNKLCSYFLYLINQDFLNFQGFPIFKHFSHRFDQNLYHRLNLAYKYFIDLHNHLGFLHLYIKIQ